MVVWCFIFIATLGFYEFQKWWFCLRSSKTETDVTDFYVRFVLQTLVRAHIHTDVDRNWAIQLLRWHSEMLNTRLIILNYYRFVCSSIVTFNWNFRAFTRFLMQVAQTRAQFCLNESNDQRQTFCNNFPLFQPIFPSNNNGPHLNSSIFNVSYVCNALLCWIFSKWKQNTIMVLITPNEWQQDKATNVLLLWV